MGLLTLLNNFQICVVVFMNYLKRKCILVNLVSMIYFAKVTAIKFPELCRTKCSYLYGICFPCNQCSLHRNPKHAKENILLLYTSINLSFQIILIFLACQNILHWELYLRVSTTWFVYNKTEKHLFVV